MFGDLWNVTFLENTFEAYCWFFGIILAGLILKRFLSRVITRFAFRFLKKYSSGIAFEKLWELLKKPVELLILLITFYLAFDRLEFPHSWNLVPRHLFGLRMIVFRSFQVAIILSMTWIVLRGIDFFGLIFLKRASYTESKSDDQLVPFIKEAVKIIVIVFALFFVLGAVFKLNIASLIAGLGIGGLAVALAAKESLENLLGSFTIFLDKPFVIGDQVQVGNISGNVERIGFRSTRIRTVDKTYVTIPNKKMVEAELDNLTLRTQRRVKVFIRLGYATTPDQLKSIIAELQTYVDNHPKIDKTESRVRLYELGASSINLLILYFVNSGDYNTYINVREETNFKLIEIVRKNGADFSVLPSVVPLQ